MSNNRKEGTSAAFYFSMQKLIPTALAITLFASGNLAVSAAEGWLVVQKSHVVGRQKVETSPGLLRVENAGFGFTAVGKVSLKKVFIFNPNSKMIYENPINDWGGFMERTILPMHAQNLMNYQIVWKKGKQIIESGRHYREYTAENLVSGKKLSGIGIDDYDGMVKVKANCRVCEDVTCDAVFAKSLALMCGFPPIPGPGLPTLVEYTDSHSGKVRLLETTKLDKVQTLAKDFELPTKYKKTLNGAELILSSGEGLGTMSDVADSLGKVSGIVAKKKP